MDTRFGLLLVGIHFGGVAEDEFNDWYDLEHMPERERIPGFVTCQRWLGVDDPRVSVGTFDLQRLEVLQSPAYRAISGANFSPWSKRIVSKCKPICRLEAEQIYPGTQAGSTEAGGLLMYATNIPAELEGEFNEWYDTEHMPLLSAVPGCIHGRRFKMSGGSHRYLATFDLASPDVVLSSAWKEAANTPWSQKMRAVLKDPLRLALRRYTRAA